MDFADGNDAEKSIIVAIFLLRSSDLSFLPYCTLLLQNLVNSSLVVAVVEWLVSQPGVSNHTNPSMGLGIAI